MNEEKKEKDIYEINEKINELIIIIYVEWNVVSRNYKQFIYECNNDTVLSGTTIPIDFIRTYHNYLGTVISLLEVTKEIKRIVEVKLQKYRQYFKLKELKDKLKNKFNYIEGNIQYKFIKKLRNCISHAIQYSMLPQPYLIGKVEVNTKVLQYKFIQEAIMQIKQQIKDGKKLPFNIKFSKNIIKDNLKIKIEKEIKISREWLLLYNPLKKEWRWNEARPYLNKLPEKIDIKIIVMEFHEQLRSFYNWFGKRFVNSIIENNKRIKELNEGDEIKNARDVFKDRKEE